MKDSVLTLFKFITLIFPSLNIVYEYQVITKLVINNMKGREVLFQTSYLWYDEIKASYQGFSLSKALQKLNDLVFFSFDTMQTVNPCDIAIHPHFCKRIKICRLSKVMKKSIFILVAFNIQHSTVKYYLD